MRRHIFESDNLFDPAFIVRWASLDQFESGVISIENHTRKRQHDVAKSATAQPVKCRTRPRQTTLTLPMSNTNSTGPPSHLQGLRPARRSESGSSFPAGSPMSIISGTVAPGTETYTDHTQLDIPTISDVLSAPQHQATKPPRLSARSNMTTRAFASQSHSRQTDASAIAGDMVAPDSSQMASAYSGGRHHQSTSKRANLHRNKPRYRSRHPALYCHLAASVFFFRQRSRAACQIARLRERNGDLAIELLSLVSILLNEYDFPVDIRAFAQSTTAFQPDRERNDRGEDDRLRPLA